MTAWTEMIGNSGLLDRLAELGPAVDQACARESNTQDAIDDLERVRAVLTFIGKRFDGADSNLLSTSNVTSLAAAIQETTAHVANFVSDGAPGHLVNARGSTDTALTLLSRLVLPTDTADLRGLREAADAYRATMSDQLRRFVIEVESGKGLLGGFAALLNETRGAFDAGTAELKSEVSAFHDEVTAAQGTLVASHDAAEQRFVEGATAALAKWESEFQAAEGTRKTTHSEWAAKEQLSFGEMLTRFDNELREKSDSMTKELEAGHGTHDGALSNLRLSYEDKGAVVLDGMKKYLARAKELVGAIGDHGVTGGFKTAADEALKQVTFFQRVTLGAMALLILFTGYTALSLHGGTLNWLDLGRRLLFTVTVGALATYAASQVSRYQQVERKNRKLELELRALGPFLEPVAPEEREKFRLKIAEVFFGKDEPVHHDKPGPATALHAATETLDKALDVMKTLLEKKKGD